MDDAITLAHLSDAHIAPVPAIGLRHLNLKRGLGYLNWRRNRQGTHRRDALDAIVADMQAQNPDHIAITGDLINLGLPGEYAAAHDWLQSIGTPERVSLVPGNHDIYTTLRNDAGVARWADYMASDVWGKAFAPDVAQCDRVTHRTTREDAPSLLFPFVRRVGPVALIGLNSAVETPPFVAAGELGGRQREALETLLPKLGAEGLIRVVLIHHPPLSQLAPPRRGLRDAPELSRILARHGAELVLHGHNHVDSEVLLPSFEPELGGVPVLGVGSSSMAHAHKNEPPGRYNLVRIGRDEDGRARIAYTTRGLDEGGRVVPIAHREIASG
ncbi:putative phosphohydrolase Icc family [Hyphomicrobium sulfonivorans]|uniref:Putative phosphohydrolase Icc family n=1 Tax=Hyphomicrobium sulfonivorans TaxID=121290 RepID=A0A109BK01_HYPSL|nr:metallophosphoesterase [Hyphomicrobium sulfonivorans]KWT70237.1 putative phosphohydrolase Icc family [Hyphomicrobium sulfonivorans]